VGWIDQFGRQGARVWVTGETVDERQTHAAALLQQELISCGLIPHGVGLPPLAEELRHELDPEQTLLTRQWLRSQR
jgi:hypothetical protein